MKGMILMKNIKEYISDKFDIPKEIIMNLPQISLTGNRELFIDNYKSILEYSDTLMRIKAADTIIKISGKSIYIENIGTDDISLSGFFDKIEFMA